MTEEDLKQQTSEQLTVDNEQYNKEQETSELQVQDTMTPEHDTTEESQEEESNNQESITNNLAVVEEEQDYETTEPPAHEIAIEAVPQDEGTMSQLASSLKSDLKSQIEAVLFVSEKPLKTGAISKMLNASYDDVQSAIVQLIQEYEDRNGGLEIGTDDGYIIQVKTQYLNIVTEMMPLELNPGPLRTLSAIALKEPCLQSIIVDMRGSGAYEHINELVELDLVTKKPQGLSFVLRTTKKFNQYFRLTQEASKVKEKLQEKAQKLAEERRKKKEEEEAAKLAEQQTVEEQTAKNECNP